MQNAPFHAASLNGLRLWFFCPCMAHPHASCSLPQRPETVIFLPIHGSPSCSACIIHYSTLWRGSSRKTELSLEDAMKKAPINEYEWSQHHINITCRWYLLQGYSLQCTEDWEQRGYRSYHPIPPFLFNPITSMTGRDKGTMLRGSWELSLYVIETSVHLWDTSNPYMHISKILT